VIQTDRTVKLKIRACLLLFLCGFSFLGVRAFSLQLVGDKRVGRLETAQADRRIVLSPARGTIFDSTGKPLAVDLQLPSIFADPALVKDEFGTARKLSKVLHLSPKEILSKIKAKKKRFVWLARKTTPTVKKQIESLDLPGIRVVEEAARIYPERHLASQVLGVVGVDGEGLEGIERYYDKFLRTKNLVVQAQKDAKGRSIFSVETELVEPAAGANLHLTIDSVIQHMTETELVAAAREKGAKHAMAVVMDPESGNILAMASYPPLNPNRLDKADHEDFRNRPVEELFEPGSTFKVFSLAAALESGWLNPNRSFLCKKGSVKLNGKVIRTHEEHDWLTPKGILKFSDNIGSSQVALSIGKKKLYDGLRIFGFGLPTGVDFPGEVSGAFKKPDGWKDIDLANVSFGQGVGVTGVQLVSALSMIANGGYPVVPHIVSKAVFPDGHELSMRQPRASSPTISGRTVSLLTEWMESVTDTDGTGAMARIEGYRVAGKTGTAQKIDPDTRTYSTRKVISSFLGFAPASNPKLAALFLFDEPAKADYGGQLAAPVFRTVIEGALNYLGVPPDRNVARSSPAVPALVSAAVHRVADDFVFGADSVPDFRGLTVREVLSRAQKVSLDVQVSGSGTAVRQIPEPGAAKAGVRKLQVFFEPVVQIREGET
jgi:cell division protein FtsI (penicillin-binding protein 3)